MMVQEQGRWRRKERSSRIHGLGSESRSFKDGSVSRDGRRRTRVLINGNAQIGDARIGA